MVSGTIHRELVRMAEDRANNAEARALALEHELRRLLGSKDCNVNTFPRSSSPKPPQIPPRMNDIIMKPMMSVGIRTSPKHFQKHNSTASAIPSTYSSGNLGGKTAEAAVVRSTAGRTGNKRAKAHNRSWSPSRLRKVEASKANKQVKNEEEKEVKNSGKVSFLQRVQSRVSSAQTKTEVQKSLFNRMQSRFFAKTPKTVTTAAPPSNCELPDVSSLEEGSIKSEYEIPMEPVQRFTRTPLILIEAIIDAKTYPRNGNEQESLEDHAVA
ncbi:uncharacterized protein [Asterias amurensis]|uniref:uncharacterized protein n=1 Tax=Asterias amurensis TaxID=7602 RepID=UPI003AB373C9